ncbi:outer membrane lipoprotein-sorting protein, partial [bacterium]|nr:outer membrane lipoprotein-sorting protein [bacterium]
MKRIKLTTAALILLFLTYSVFAQEPFTAKDIIDKSRKAKKIAGVESAATLIIIDGKGRERIRKNAQISKLYDNGKTEKKLFKFISPADVKGTGLLTFDYEDKDDDMWL